MNSLEWINRQIKECKQSIKQSEIRINEYKKYPSWVKGHKEQIEELKPILKVLEQIKTELEAWEVVKEDIVYQKDIPCEERPEYTYEFKKWVFEINEDEYDFEEKSIKIKKALEVNND